MPARFTRWLALLGAFAAGTYACVDDQTASTTEGDGGPGGGDGSTTGSDGGPGGPSDGSGGGDGSALGCEGGTTACGAKCVDLGGDGANCGACGHDCLGGGCAVGKCQPKNVFNPHGTDAAASAVGSIAVDGTSIYWVAPRVPNPGQQLQLVDCAIFKCPLGSDCAVPRNLIAEHEINALLYATSTAGVLYYTDDQNDSIRRLGVDGADAGSNVTPCSSGGGSPCGFTGAPASNVMTSDGTTLYWGTNYNNTGGFGVFKASFSAPGTTTKLGPASGTTSVVGIAIDPDDGSHLWTYTVDYEGNLYAYRNDQSDQIPETIASSQGHPGGVVVAYRHLFWTNPATGQISTQEACTNAGCKTPPLYSPSTFVTFAASEALTADATRLYWTAGGRILTCPLTGCPAGQPQELANQTSPVHVITNDANAIYFGDEQGAVWRLAK